MAVLALVLTGVWAFAWHPAGAAAAVRPAALAADPAEIRSILALARQLEAENDRMTVGLAQMALNAASGDRPAR